LQRKRGKKINAVLIPQTAQRGGGKLTRTKKRGYNGGGDIVKSAVKKGPRCRESDRKKTAVYSLSSK